MKHDRSDTPHGRDLSRRGALRLGGGLTAAAALGAGTAATLWGGSASAAPSHPALLHTATDLARMADKVAGGQKPWTDCWQLLVNSPYSASTYVGRPTATVIRGGAGANFALLFKDANAAYLNALRWKISGNTAHANCARDILNGWSATLQTLTGNADRFLMAGTQGWQLANAGELMRGYTGFDTARFATMLKDKFYPLNNQFLTQHNGACITNYRANWDLCNMASVFAIGGFTDDQAKIDQAVNYFKNGGGNGSIKRAVNFLHENGTIGQWEESGRDQGHTMGGIGWMGVLCEMAWHHGIDLYGYDSNRFMKGCEYVARYNRGLDVPYTPYSWQQSTNCAWKTESVIGSANRGDTSPIWAMIHHHYAVRKGLSVPNITAWMNKLTPENGAGYRGDASGGFDHLGYGTLTYRE